MRSPFRVFAPKKSFATTLLDPKLYPAQELENSISGAGTSNCTSARSNHAGHGCLALPYPEMVLKELAMHQIAYNLIRALMQRALSPMMSTWSAFPSKALWTASIITQMPSMPPTAAPVNRPSSSMLCFAPSPPIWSPGAPNAANLALANVAQKTINYLPNLVKKWAPHQRKSTEE